MRLSIYSFRTDSSFRRDIPCADEHAEALRGGLYDGGDDHDPCTHPDSGSATEAVGDIWREWICAEGADVLRRMIQ